MDEITKLQEQIRTDLIAALKQFIAKKPKMDNNLSKQIQLLVETYLLSISDLITQTLFGDYHRDCVYLGYFIQCSVEIKDRSMNVCFHDLYAKEDDIGIILVDRCGYEPYEYRSMVIANKPQDMHDFHTENVKSQEVFTEALSRYNNYKAENK